MSKKHEFVKILQDNYEILNEFFDETGGFFRRRKKYTKEEAKEALCNIQKAINEYISFDETQDRYYIDNIKFGFMFDEDSHDTNLLYDIPSEFDENFQLISFELDRIFPERLEGNWLVTTYKIVVSDDTVTLYNHNENFKYELLENILTKPISSMTLEDATILQYVLSWIVIIVQFCESETTDRETFIDLLLDHKFDDINFYNEYDFEQALNTIV